LPFDFRILCLGIGVALGSILGVPPIHALTNHSANYRSLLIFLCGGEDASLCSDRMPPITDVELATLAAELERFAAVAEFEEGLEPTERLRRDLFRFCEDDPARCLDWVHQLSQSEGLDADLDGVVDTQDACLGSDTPLARAGRILLAQLKALADVQRILERSREVLIHGVNGTFAPSQQRTLASSFPDLHDALLAVANRRTDGRFLFSGLVQEAVPFVATGDFGEGTVPTVEYVGDDGRLDLPVGRSGALVPATWPGSTVFLGDPGFGIDGENLFELLANAYLAFLSNDVGALQEGLFATEGARQAIVELVAANAELGNGARAPVLPTPERAEVDERGCTRAQFCEAIAIESFRSLRTCAASDFRNDEPLRRAPQDCRVGWERGSRLACVAR